MTTEQKARLQEMRCAGLSFGEISAQLNIPINTIKSFCRRNEASSDPAISDPNTAVCSQCGVPLSHKSKHKLRRFCGSDCRIAFWNTHRELHDTHALQILRCANCGQEFESYSNPNRKYCSHACFIANRYQRKVEYQ
jgi:endogenous inhibitor of DNA gyrase (YacG/DUF329 family)